MTDLVELLFIAHVALVDVDVVDAVVDDELLGLRTVTM